MAEFFKSAARAGTEVRRLGQLGPEAEKDQSLRALSRTASDGMDSIPAVAATPRRGITPPPQLEGTPEDSIQSVLNDYFKDVPQEAPPPGQDSEGTLIGDLGRSAARGVVGLGGGIYELGNMVTRGALDDGTKALFGTSGTEAITSARESLNQADSAALQAQRAELEKADGFFESFATVLSNPRLAGSMAMEMVPQLATVVGAARFAAGRAITSAVSKGATKEAAELAGQKAAARTALGLNAGLEGGMASQDVRSDIMRMSEAELSNSPQYQALISQGVSPEDARGRLANDASMVAAATAASISALSSKVFGNVESSLARRGLAGDVAPRSVGEVAKNIAIGGVKETAQESFEEGGSQFGQNLGQMVAVNPDQDLTQGVASAAGAGGALGLLVGGAGNVRLPKGDEPAPAAPPAPAAADPAAPQATPAAAPVGLSDQEFQQVFRTTEDDGQGGLIDIPNSNAVPYLSALYLQADTNKQSQLQEIARRQNLNVNLAETSQDASIVGRGVRMVEANPGFANAFLQRLNTELVAQDTVPVQPKTVATPDAQINEEVAKAPLTIDERQDLAAVAAEQSAIEAGVAPSTTPAAQAEDQAISQPTLPQGLEVLMRGYQRRAQNIQNLPDGARRAAASSSMTDMVAAGFTAEQAQQVFGRFIEGDAGGAPSVPAPVPAAPVPEATQPTETVPSDVPAGPVGFTKIRDDLVSFDQQKYGVPSKSTDYLEVPVDPAIAQIASSFGVKVFAYRYTGGDRKLQRRKGTRTPNGIALNANSPDSHMAIFGHEVYHELARRNPAAAEQLNQEVKKYLTEDGKKRYEKWFKQSAYDPSEWSEEITADVMGVLFTDGEFWGQVNQKNPSLVEKVLQVITDLLDRMNALPQRLQKTKSFITDFEAVRTLLSDFVNQTTNQEADLDFTQPVVSEMVDQPPEKEVPLRVAPTGPDQDSVEFTSGRERNPAVGKGTFVAEEAPISPARRAEDVAREREQIAAERNRRPLSAAEYKEQLIRYAKRVADFVRGTTTSMPEAPTQMNLFGAEMNQAINTEIAKIFNFPGVGESYLNEMRDIREALDKLDDPMTGLNKDTQSKLKKQAKANFDKQNAAVASGRRKGEPLPLATLERIEAFKFRKETFGKGNKRSDVEYVFKLFGEDIRAQSGAGLTAAKKQLLQSLIDTNNRRTARIVQEMLTKPDAVVNRLAALQQVPEFQLDEAVRERMNGLVNAVEVAILEGRELQERITQNPVNSREYNEGVALAEQYIAKMRDTQPIAEASEETDDTEGDAATEMGQMEDMSEARVLPIDTLEEPADLTSSRNAGEKALRGLRDVETQTYVALQKIAGVEGVTVNTLEAIVAPVYTTEEDLGATEEAVDQEDLFGDAQVEAAQIVDAMLKDGIKLQNMSVLLDKAQNVGNLDIYAEMRRRGLTVPAEMVSLASHPGVKYSLDYWMKKNQGRDPYVVRREWLGSIDDALIKLRAMGQPDSVIFKEMDEGDRAAYEMYRKGLAELEGRLKKAILQDTEGGYLFTDISNAFPHSIFTKYPLSAAFNPSQMDATDRAAYLAMVGGKADQLPTLYFEDLNFALTNRNDLSGEILDTLSEADYKRYIEWRDRQIRSRLTDAKRLTNSPTYSQLSQLGNMLTPEQYQKFWAAIDLADQNEQRALLQNAFELAMAQRAARAAGVDPDAAADAILSSFEQRDQLAPNSFNTSLEEVDPNDERFVEDLGADEGIGAIIDRLRTKMGTSSGAVPASIIQDHLIRLTANWPNSPRFQVLPNVRHLSPTLRKAVLKKLGNSQAQGLIGPDGEIYLFSDHIGTLEDAEFVFFHELYGHFGMRQFLGNKLDGFLETQYKLNKKLKSAADALIAEAKDAGREMSVLEATEEAISDLAANAEEPSLFQRIVQELMRFFRGLKMNSIADWMESHTGANLAFLLKDIRNSVRQGRMGPLNGAPTDIRFSASKLPFEIFGTKGKETTAYARYNPVVGQWTVFYNADKLSDGNYGISTVETYEEAYDLVKQYGKPTSAKPYPDAALRNPGSFKVKIDQPSNVAGWRKTVRKWKLDFYSKRLPIYDVVRQIREQGGQTNLDRVLKLRNGRIKFAIDQTKQKYLLPITQLTTKIEEAGATINFADQDYTGIDLVGLYLYAYHAPERNDYISRLTAGKEKEGSGISDKQALMLQDKLRSLGVTQELEQIRDLMRKLSEEKMSMLLAAGKISVEAARAMSQYKNYVSLFGNRETNADKDGEDITGGRMINNRAKIKQATGRFTIAGDIVENTLQGYMQSIVMAQNNLVGESVLSMVEENYDPTFAIINPYITTKTIDIDKLISDRQMYRAIGDVNTPESGKEFLKDLGMNVKGGRISESEAAGQIYQRLVDARDQGYITTSQFNAFVQKLDKVTSDGKLKDGTLNTDGYISFREENNLQRPNVFVVNRNGRLVSIEFKEGPDSSEKLGTFFSALHGDIVPNESGQFEFFGKINRLVGQLITSKNLAWVPVNWIRDMGTAFKNAAADDRIGLSGANMMRKEMLRSYGLVFKYLIDTDYKDKNSAVYKLLKKFARKPMKADDARLFEEFKAMGGETYFMDRKNIEEYMDEIRNELNPRGGIKGTWDAYGKFVDLLAQPAELSARFAAYKVLTQKLGWSKEEAAVYAKEITVNFEESGKARWFRNLFMFFNPSIQGTARMFRDYSKRKGVGALLPNKEFAAIATSLMALGMVAGFIGRAMGGDDEDKNGINDLDQIPTGKRATSIVLLPGTPLGAPIPLAYGWNVFYAMGTFMSDSIFGDTPLKQTAMRVTSAFLNSFWPTGAKDTGNPVYDTLGNLVPTAISPVADLVMNENRQGSPIYKDNKFGGAEESPAYRNFDSASPISTFVFQGLNDLTGGNRYEPGMVSINPAWIDHLASSYLPGPITDVGRAANLGIRAAIGRDVDNVPLPLVDRFGSKVSPQWDAGAFRRAQTYVDTKYKAAITSFGEDREKFLKKDPNLGYAKNSLDRIDQTLRTLRTNLRAVEQNPNVPFSEKVATRNKVVQLERAYYRQAVELATKAGFKDQVLADN